jgi:hypothetical protein
MDFIERIFEYKRLAQIMSDKPDKETAAIIMAMCDEDKQLRSDKHSRGLDFRSQQAVIFIGAIGCKRPKAGDALEVLDSKAEDILWEIAEFERV